VRIRKSFELGKYEVTQAQWESLMGTNPCYFRGAARPVETVSWTDIQEFMKKWNARKDGYHYRLPGEEEWEYAARSGRRGPYEGSLESVAFEAARGFPPTYFHAPHSEWDWLLIDG
jgi:formylglycine-generating enzyme required for sulfatase activity